MLRKKQDLEAKIIRYEGLYITLEGDDDILYCAHCWDSERKLIQMYKDNGIYKYSHCDVKGIYDRHRYKEHSDSKKWICRVGRENIW